MSRPGRFLRGAGFLLRGAAMLARGRGLRRWALLPMVTSLLLFAALAAGAAWGASSLGAMAGEGVWGSLAAWAAGAGAVLIVLAGLYFTFGLVANVVSSPFNEVLSARVERMLRGRLEDEAPASVFSEAARAAVSAVKLFAVEMAVMIIALPVLLVPVAGAVLFAAPASFFTAMAFLDYPFGRRRMGVRERQGFCRSHLAEILGFGAAAYILALVPLINLLVIPSAAVGATMLIVELSGGAAPVAGARPGRENGL